MRKLLHYSALVVILLCTILISHFAKAEACSPACNYCTGTDAQGRTWCGLQDTVGVKYPNCSSTGSQRLLCAPDHSLYSCSLQYTWPFAIRTNNCQKVGSYYCDELNDRWTTTNPCETISIDANSVIAQIDNKLYGLTFVIIPVTNNLLQKTYMYHDDPRYKALIRAIKPGVLRNGGFGPFYWTRRGSNAWVKISSGSLTMVSIENGRLKAEGDASTRQYQADQLLNFSKLTPGATYILSADIEGFNIPPKQYDYARGLRLGIFYTDDTSSWRSINPYVADIDVGDGTTPNRRVSTNFVFQPAPNKKIKQAILRVGLENGTGTLWVDNVALVNAVTGENLVKDGEFDNIWWPPYPYKEILTPYDIDYFVNFSREVGAEPLISIGLEMSAYAWNDTRDAESRARAQDLVRYANIEKNYGIKYWELGTEAEVWGNIFWGWAWPTEFLTTAKNYTKRYGEYYNALKAIDPNIKTTGGGSYTPSFFLNVSSKTFMSTKTADVDFFDIHHYPLQESIPGYATIERLLSYHIDNDEAYNYLYTSYDDEGTIGYIDTFLQNMTDLINAYDPDAKIALTEYGPGGSMETANGLADALWTAEMLGRLANHNAGLAAGYWLLGDLIIHDSLFESSNYIIRPSYYTYFLFANHYGTDITNTTTSYSPFNLNVSAFSSKSDDGNKLYLMVVNRDYSNRTLSISLNNFNRPNLKGRAYILTGQNLASRDGVNINGQIIDPNNVTGSISAIQPVVFNISGQTFAYAFPPYSVTAIEVSNQSAVIGDFDGNGIIDIIDLITIAQKFGKSSNDAGWDSSYDIASNNKIDIYDIVFVASRFT